MAHDAFTPIRCCRDPVQARRNPGIAVDPHVAGKPIATLRRLVSGQIAQKLSDFKMRSPVPKRLSAELTRGLLASGSGQAGALGSGSSPSRRVQRKTPPSLPWTAGLHVCGCKNLTLKTSMSDFIRRVSSLSKWFESCRHALASDLFFAAFGERFGMIRRWQRVLLSASWEKKIAFPFIAVRRDVISAGV